MPSRIVSPEEIAALAPEVELTGIIGGSWCPRDGLVDPHGLLQGYVSNARRLGATLLTSTSATAIETSGGRVQRVVTNDGTIETPTVVIAAGPWSGQVGAMAGIDLPIEPIRRQIAVTAPIPGLRADFPFVIDFSRALYFHREGTGILTGMSNRDEPPGFDTSVDESWRLHHLENAMERLAAARRRRDRGGVGRAVRGDAGRSADSRQPAAGRRPLRLRGIQRPRTDARPGGGAACSPRRFSTDARRRSTSTGCVGVDSRRASAPESTTSSNDEAPRGITRRDFIDATLVGVGAALLSAPSPASAMAAAAEHIAPPADTFTGPGGVGDYAASNGNTKPVIDAAHTIRDGAYGAAPKATDTGEVYDLVVVGGGITGLTAAYFFAKDTENGKTCLVLDNHPIFGGEAKQNEFLVNGVRLIAPQGSNDFGVPRQGAGWQSEMWDDLRMPREFTWSRSAGGATELRMAQDNYQPMDGIGEYGVDIGYYFDERSSLGRTAKPTWLKNIWQNDLSELPVSDDVKRELLQWRSTAPNTDGRTPEQFARYLDTSPIRIFSTRPDITTTSSR